MTGGEGAVIAAAAAYLSTRLQERPRVGLILGSGLGGVTDELAAGARVPFAEVPGFAPPTVAGHDGVVVAGRLEGVATIALRGRYHLYEGHAPAVVVRPLRALLALGVRTVIITNAAGAVNPYLRTGDVMVIADHINMMWRNPLIGPVLAGEARFPDMAQPYDLQLQQLAAGVARGAGVRVTRGVYCGVLGPAYETPAEIRAYRALGADAIGMSTVPEVLAARAAGARVLGLSLITNPAAGLAPAPLAHADVVEAGARARGYFGAVLRGVLRDLADERAGVP